MVSRAGYASHRFSAETCASCPDHRRVTLYITRRFPRFLRRVRVQRIYIRIWTFHLHPRVCCCCFRWNLAQSTRFCPCSWSNQPPNRRRNLFFQSFAIYDHIQSSLISAILLSSVFCLRFQIYSRFVREYASKVLDRDSAFLSLVIVLHNRPCFFRVLLTDRSARFGRPISFAFCTVRIVSSESLHNQSFICGSCGFICFHNTSVFTTRSANLQFCFTTHPGCTSQISSTSRFARRRNPIAVSPRRRVPEK